MSGDRQRSPAPGHASDQHWLFTLLPAFPVLLLVMRLWLLSRQDAQTMLLLVENVSPLGLVSTLLTALLWVVPVGILVIRALGALLCASVADTGGSLLARASMRTPGWVLVIAIMLAGLTWQLRFLPTLTMLTLAIVALDVRVGRPQESRPRASRLVLATGVVVPAVVAVSAYAWFGPAIVDAFSTGETVTALLLLLPPGLTLLLTGPVPERSARVLTHWTAMVAGLLAPFLIGAIFVHTPILPSIAVEAKPESGDPKSLRVLRGQVAAVDDRMTALLEGDGTVLFLPNDQLVSKVLCPDARQIPSGAVEAHGWHTEESTMEWLAPRRPVTPPDPRCQGRPLEKNDLG